MTRSAVRDDGSMMWAFEDYELDVDQFELRRGSEQVRVEPQVFDVLRYLVERQDRVVAKTEILDAVWGDRFVSESALTTRIKAARQALDDDGSAQRLIRTVFGRGYQFVGRAEPLPTDGHLHPSVGDAVSEAVEPSQTIRFCATDDGIRLAYATMGDGPPLVRAAHWLTHLDYDLASPVWRHWLLGLSTDRTLIRYDERGCGMSSHDVEEFSLDGWVRDLETVVDAVGLERFDLLGMSQGGPVAISYAVRHPERVRRLVLYGTYVQGRLDRAEDETEAREAAVNLEMAWLGWGSRNDSYLQFFASQFIPDGGKELWAEFSQLQRRTTSATNASRFMEAFSRIDVMKLAPLVHVPTLVLHARGDLRVRFEHGQKLAALIPDTRFVPLDTSNHLMLAEEPAFAVFLTEVRRFLDEE